MSGTEVEAFRKAAKKLADDLNRGRIRAGLRLKRVAGTDGIWEMTWAEDGRATFEYGEEVRQGHKHVVWRRVGTHAVLRRP